MTDPAHILVVACAEKGLTCASQHLRRDSRSRVADGDRNHPLLRREKGADGNLALPSCVMYDTVTYSPRRPFPHDGSVMIRTAPGTISSFAGSIPGCSPSTSSSTCWSETAPTYLPVTIRTFFISAMRPL
jgi:hypothetical protein